MEKNEVSTAFRILLEEIEILANALNDSGAEALKNGRYDKARQCIEEATRLSEFREKVKSLQKEWKKLCKGRGKHHSQTREISENRLPRGLRTPENAFRRPILESLVELGGSAKNEDVLRKVESKMKSVFKPSDLKMLPSNHRVIRWKNTACWCRYKLVQEGLMKSNSPTGVWEIAEAGKRWLKRN